MNLIQVISDHAEYIILALTVATVVLLLLIIILLIKQGNLNKKYKKFMTGANGESLEKVVLERFLDVDILKDNTKQISNELINIKDNLLYTYQKIAVLKYDAFKEMGGKLSFVLVLLDKNNNGFLLNSVHSSREGCYIYLKEILKGESFLELSEDEKKALKQAINSNNYMV